MRNWRILASVSRLWRNQQSVRKSIATGSEQERKAASVVACGGVCVCVAEITHAVRKKRVEKIL